MSARRNRALPLQRKGFTLIELMVALLLSLFLVGGVVAVLVTNTQSSRVQQSISRMLENGRYASQFMADELRMAGVAYCAEFATVPPTVHGMTPVRPIFLNANTAAVPKWLLPNPTSGPVTRFPIDPGVFIQGYECDTAGACIPTLPNNTQDVNVVPAAGTTLGARARGTDVLTIRYLNGNGAPIATSAGGTADIAMNAAELATLGLGANDLALISDCGNAEIFAQSVSAGAISHTVAIGNYIPSLVGSFTRGTDSRIFNFTRDFVSVTYYVGLVADPQTTGRLIPALMRIVNGAAAQPLVLGVERLDFTFAVADAQQDIHFLKPNQVQVNSPGVVCPPVKFSAPNLLGPAAGAGRETAGNCLWRAVQGIEVSMLMNSIRDDGSGNDPFKYSPDGTSVQSYAPSATLPNGLSAGRMMRREFRFFATLHGFSR